MNETAFVIDSNGVELPAVLHAGAAGASTGVIVVVGGPQYRVGSHRQFVLLARSLAAAGVPVLRFDYRGMGDAGGDDVGFEGAGPDIRAAVDAFTERVPGLTGVVLWGLCDAASASLFYAPGDRRVTGLVLLNPWVRTDSGEARAYLTHYYGGRLASGETWRRLFRGDIRVLDAVRSVLGLARRAFRSARPADAAPSLPDRMRAGLEAFQGRVLLVISGQDLTAAEFLDVVQGCPRWQQALDRPTVRRVDLPEANHTFSTAAHRDRVAEATREWLFGDTEQGGAG